MRHNIKKVLFAISVLCFFISVVSSYNAFAIEISQISAQETREDIATSIPFLVTASGDVSYTLSSSNQSLIPNDYLLCESSGKYYTMVATPAFNAVGTAVISITVNDNKDVTSTSFALTVTDTDDSLSYWTDFQVADVVIGESGIELNNPSGVAVDPNTGKLFVSDSDNNRILRFASAEAAELSGATSEAIFGVTTTTMNGPTGICVDTFGRLWVADTNNHRVLRYDNASTKVTGAAADGVLGRENYTSNTSAPQTYTNTMNSPTDVWVDSAGRLWVADLINHRILRFDKAGAKEDGDDADEVLGQENFTTNSSGNSQSQMNSPISIIGSTTGHLFVADLMNNRVLCYTNVVQKRNLANASIVLGQFEFDEKNPSTSQTGMQNPSGLGLDAYGNLYVADLNNNRVLIFKDAINKSNGDAADHVLGQDSFDKKSENNGNTEPNPSTLHNPYFLNVDIPNDYLWVADYGNNRVLRFTLNYKSKPIIGIINSRTITENTTEAIPFTVTDNNSQSLTITYSFSISTMLTQTSFSFTGDQVALNNSTYTVYAISTPTTITLNIMPNVEQSGNAAITITVTDSDGLTAQNSFSLTVVSIDDVPTITSIENQTMDEDGTSTAIPFSVTDIEGNAMSITITSSDKTLFPSNPDNITLSNASGGTTYTLISATESDSMTLWLRPTTNKSGNATITVTVSDGANKTIRTFSMIVNPINDPPEISHIFDQQFAEDTSTTISFTVTDVEEKPLTISVVSSNTSLIPSNAANITLMNENGGSSYTLTTNSIPDQLTLELMPALNQFGSVTMTVYAHDGSITTTHSFSISVTPVNDLPTIENFIQYSQTTNEDQELTGITFKVSDIESSTLTITIQSDDANLFPSDAKNITLSNATDGTSYTLATSSNDDLTLALMPTTNQSGTANITIVVSDGAAEESKSFSVTVTPVYDKPEISAINDIETNEDTKSNPITFSVANPDGDLLTIAIAAPDAQQITLKNETETNNPLTTSSESNAFTLTLLPMLNNTNPVMVTVTVNNGTDDVARSFTLTVIPVNDVPTISFVQDQTISEDGRSNAISITVTDPESDALTIEVQSGDPVLIPADALHITLSNASGGNSYSLVTNPGSLTLVLMPQPNKSGTTTITVTVRDTESSAHMSFTVTVTEINDLSSISEISDISTTEDPENPVAIHFKVVDVDEEQLTITVQSSNEILFPAKTENISIQNVSSSEYSLVTLPGDLTLVVMPEANKSGTAFITITVADAKATTSTSFAITVTEINDPPIISDIENVSTEEETKISDIKFTVSDVDASALTINVNSGNTDLVPANAGHMTLCNSEDCHSLSLTTNSNPDSLTLELLPEIDQAGVVTITVTVSDGITTNSEAFNLTIINVNDPPVISNITNQTFPEDASIAIAFTATDLEDTTCLQIETKSSNQTIIADENISITCNGDQYTLTAVPTTNEYGGPVQITIIAEDSGPLTSTTSFSITLTAVNDPPSITLPKDVMTKRNVAKSIPGVTIVDIDAANNPITITLVAGQNDTITLNAQHGSTLTITNTIEEINTLLNNLQFQPASNASGIRLITITVNDLGGDTGENPRSVSETLQITVTSNNMAPEIHNIPTSLTVEEDQDLTITQIVVRDVDAGENSIQITLTTNKAYMTLSETNGLTLDHYEASSLSIVVSGPINDINNALGSLTLTFTSNFSGEAMFTITTSDLGNTGTDNKILYATDSFTITVVPVNDAPLNSLPKSLTINEGEAALFTSSVSDPDDITIQVNLSVANGILQLSQVTGLAGNYTNNNSLSFTGHINDVNKALSEIRYIPDSEISGNYIITMTSSDAQSETDTKELTVTIIAENDPPVISCEPLADSTNEDTALALSASVTDIDAGDNEIRVVIFAADGSVSITVGETVKNASNLTITDTVSNINKALSAFSFSPTTNFFGDTGITITVNDLGNSPSSEKSDSEVISVTVISVNDPPVFQLSQTNISVVEDFSEPQVITVTLIPLAFGESGDVTYTLSPYTCNFANVMLDSGSGTVTITKIKDQHGSDVFTLTANDGESENNTYSDNFALTIQSENDPPSFTIDRNEINLKEDFVTTEIIVVTPDPVPENEQDQEVLYSINPESLTWVNMKIDSETGQITITKIDHAYGNQIIQIIANDPDDAYSRTFELIVTQVNDAPTITSSTVFTLDENLPAGTIVYTITAIDLDGDALTYSITTVHPVPFTISSSNPQIWLTEPTNYEEASGYTLAISVFD